MGKYDYVFGAEGVSEQTLSPKEAPVAIAVVTFVADGQDPMYSWMLYDFMESAHAAFGKEEIETLEDKLFGILNKEGIGVLFNTAVDALSHDVIDESFNLIEKSFEGAIFAMTTEASHSENELKCTFLEELAKVLGVDEEYAQELLDISFGIEEDEEV